MEFTVFVIAFVVLFVLGMPIPFTMITSSVIYGLLTGIDMSFYSLESYKALYNFTLLAIPMFMLTAEVMNASTVADRMFGFANSLVGWIPGGLGHTNILTSVIFAGMSGSAAADTSGIGYLSYKSMVDRGFDRPFSAAVTAASSCIGPIIPPSIPVIIYCMSVPAVSVGSLFMAGVIPGVLMAVVMMLYVAYTAKKRGYPIEKRPNAKELLAALRYGILPVLTPVILLVSISGGFVTVSEGAIITVIYSCILGFIVYRRLGLKTLFHCCRNICLTMGSILVFFLATKMFSYVITKENLVNIIGGAVSKLTTNPLGVLMIINLFFLIMGCLSDPLVNIMLFAPLAWSVASSVGLDPVAFGLIVVLNTQIGIITPPVGAMAFLISGITKVPLHDIFKELMPFVAGLLLLLVIISIFPGIVTFLPNLLMK